MSAFIDVRISGDLNDDRIRNLTKTIFKLVSDEIKRVANNSGKDARATIGIPLEVRNDRRYRVLDIGGEYGESSTMIEAVMNSSLYLPDVPAVPARVAPNRLDNTTQHGS